MGFIVKRGIVLALIAVVVLGVVLANDPTTAFRKEFIVSVPRDAAWDHFNRATEWPSWAGYIKSVELAPPGDIGPTTIGTVNLQNGQSTTFSMTAFEPKDHWQWSTSLLWFTLDYDHIFQRVSDLETRIVLHMKVKGFGKSLLAFAIDQMTRGDLDASIPRLIKEMNERATGRPGK
jgi:hypothetical protein